MNSDLDLSTEDAAFRDEVRTFLEENLTPEMRRASRLTLWAFAEFEYGRQWQKILHKKGWGAPTWPREYGGPGWTASQQLIWEAECVRAGAPGVMEMGSSLCAPCIMRFGTDEQKSYFLPRILAGEDWWAQGYSEPGAGSDLASLKLKAESDGDAYILNGSKIWTTFAQYANRIFCLVRTAQTEKKQAGISFLLIDIDSPGIEIRPIINLAGDHEFNEVFFTNVRVPKSRLLGKENEGWSVARFLLSYEHGLAIRASASIRARLSWLLEIAATESNGYGGTLLDDSDFVYRLAETAIEVDALEVGSQQLAALVRSGEPPGSAAPLLGIRSREVSQRLTELLIEAVGYFGIPFEPGARKVEPTEAPVHTEASSIAMPLYLSQRAATIAGGTPEVHKNNLAKHLLGL